MENNQNTQHQPSESNYSPPSRSKRELRQLDRSYFLAKLIQHRPWLLWLGVAAFLFTIIYISILSITQTGYVKNEEPAPVVSTKPSATSSQDSPVPLWLLGTVVLGFAAGAVAIAKRPHGSQLSQLYQRFQSASKKTILRRRERKVLLRNQQPTLSTPLVVESATAETVPEVSMQPPPDILWLEFTEQPLPEGTTFSSEDQILDLRESEEDSQLKEKILPILENQLFNLAQESEAEDEAFVSNTESLAEMLDIRKKIPLSAILGESVQRLEKKHQQ